MTEAHRQDWRTWRTNPSPRRRFHAQSELLRSVINRVLKCVLEMYEENLSRSVVLLITCLKQTCLSYFLGFSVENSSQVREKIYFSRTVGFIHSINHITLHKSDKRNTDHGRRFICVRQFVFLLTEHNSQTFSSSSLAYLSTDDIKG